MSGSDVHFSVGFTVFTVKYFSIFGNLYFSLPGASGKKESSAFIKLDYLLTFEVLVVQKLTDCHLPNLPEDGAHDHVIKTHLKKLFQNHIYCLPISKQGTAAHLLFLHVSPGEARYYFFVHEG